MSGGGPAGTQTGGGDPMDPEKAQGGEGDSGKSLLATNDLVYILPPDLSVSVNQTHKNQFFQSNSYNNNQRAVCILNTGADYGDLRNSSFDFTIGVTADANTTLAYLGRNGSILNIIKSITISSRSGDELSRIQDFNLLSYHQNVLRYDEQWHSTVGQSIGYRQYLNNNAAGSLQQQRFSIPLYLLSDFFGYGRLMPSMVLSGLRIEIEWATPGEAFLAFNAADRNLNPNSGALAITAFTITDPLISIRSVQLTDATQRSLNEMSATNGLELVYCDYERTDRVEPAQQVNLEIRKAASRALKAFAITRNSARVSGEHHGRADSLRSDAWSFTNWQWQLGSLYFPQQPVSTTGAASDILTASYKHALIAYEKYCTKTNKRAALRLYKNGPIESRLFVADNIDLLGAANGLSPYSRSTPVADQDYQSFGEVANADFDYGTFAEGNGMVATTLERSDLFNLSGVPINNSRVLAIRAFNSFPVPAGTANVVTAYLKYVRLARVFLNNVEVEQ